MLTLSNGCASVGGMVNHHFGALVYIFVFALSFGAETANATITLLAKDKWRVEMNGFAEVDTISDSTRSYREVLGNSPVSLPNTASGANGRTQFSMRDSRLALSLFPPEFKGWTPKAYFEFDFLGYDPSNTNVISGSSPPNNSETSFFSSPTLRIRHFYLQVESDGFSVLVGQYWNLLGWQPYYFLGTIEPSPLPGMLYQRNVQLRGTKTIKFGDYKSLSAAIAAVRPPQADSQTPSLEAGLRFAMGERTSGFVAGGSARKSQPMSIAISGTLRDFAIPSSDGVNGDNTHYAGSAIAVDAMVPILASADGVDVSNTLSLLGEFTSGIGYGDQLVGWTGNTSNPLNTSANVPSKNVNLDGGIGDYDHSATFHLIHLQTFNLQAQYHLPEFTTTWISVGYSRLFSNNIGDVAFNGQSTSSGAFAYNRNQLAFVNVAHDVTPEIRVGLEYDHIKTDYDAISTSASNNRYFGAFYFIF